VVRVLHRWSPGTSNRSKCTVHSRMHGRQISHKRHVRRVQQLQLRLVIDKPRHPVHMYHWQILSASNEHRSNLVIVRIAFYFYAIDGTCTFRLNM